MTAVDCLCRLKAIVSLHPYALGPIEPVLDFDLTKFDLTKFAFVEGLDPVTTLDSRPNLRELAGTMEEKKAGGVLVTTSRFTQAAKRRLVIMVVCS